MTAPNPLFLLQSLQIKDSRLYDYLRFTQRRIEDLESQLAILLNTPAATPVTPVTPGAALGGDFSVNFSASLSDTISGTQVDARITGTEFIVLGLGSGGAGHTDGLEDPVIEQLHIMVSSVAVGSFSWVAHAPNKTKNRYNIYWVGVA